MEVNKAICFIFCWFVNDSSGINNKTIDPMRGTINNKDNTLENEI